MSALEEPVLHARLKLTMLPDPAMARPAVAEAILDVDGGLVRAHVAARTTAEAADLLERRLGNRLDHAQHVLDRGAPVPSVRPSYCDRPVQARELVRHKTFTLAEVSVDEAISDMEVLDYDFHLFRDRASGENSLVWRSDDGGYALARLHASEVPIEPTDAPIDVARADAPTLTLAAALERVDSGPERFVLFADAETGRGNVAYRRFDGHYGLITPSRGIAPSWRVTGGLGVHPSIGPIRSTARTPTP